MKRIKPIAIAMAVLSCGSAFAQAQTGNPSWYITPSVSAMKPDSQFGVGKNGEGLGLRWGKPLSQSWDIQFGPTWARASNNGLRYEQATLGADWLYLFSRGDFRPFLLAGVGAERSRLTGTVNNLSKTSPYIDAGFGFQYAFSDQWSTQVDLRRVHGHVRDNSAGLSRSNNDYLTFGLTYTFDKPQQVAAAMPRPAPQPAPAPPPAPEPVRTAPVPQFERYTLSATELFNFDSAELNPAQARLDEVATALKNDASVENVVISGYTDRLGSAKYNQELSLHRAEAVKAYLANKGVNPGRMVTEGKGEANPVVTCKPAKRSVLIKCLEPNRRVEVEQITVRRRIN